MVSVTGRRRPLVGLHAVEEGARELRATVFTSASGQRCQVFHSLHEVITRGSMADAYVEVDDSASCWPACRRVGLHSSGTSLSFSGAATTCSVAACGNDLGGLGRFGGPDAHRTSYQPAWPVIGSELLIPRSPSGNSLGDQVVQQEAQARFVGRRGQLPGAAGLADRVPGPDRVGFRRLAVADHAANPAHLLSTQHQPPSAMPAAPAVSGLTCRVVVAVDRTQPGVLRVPRVIHRHRPLGDRAEGKAGGVGCRPLPAAGTRKGRVEVGGDVSRSAAGGWRPGSCLAPRGGKALQRVGIHGELHRIVLLPPALSWRSRGRAGSSCA